MGAGAGVADGLHPSLIYCALSGLLGVVDVVRPMGWPMDAGDGAVDGPHPSLIYCALSGLLGWVGGAGYAENGRIWRNMFGCCEGVFYCWNTRILCNAVERLYITCCRAKRL
jgi:hypothetical protein